MLVYRFYRKSLRKRRGVSQLEWSFSNFNNSAGPAPGAFGLSGAILSENSYPQSAFSLDRALAAILLYEQGARNIMLLADNHVM
jgi:hypothetical protein